MHACIHTYIHTVEALKKLNFVCMQRSVKIDRLRSHFPFFVFRFPVFPYPTKNATGERADRWEPRERKGYTIAMATVLSAKGFPRALAVTDKALLTANKSQNAYVGSNNSSDTYCLCLFYRLLKAFTGNFARRIKTHCLPFYDRDRRVYTCAR